MNWDQVEGKWKQYRGQVREKWGELTDDDIGVIGGNKDALIGRLQERYGFAKERAAEEVDSFIATLKHQPVESVRSSSRGGYGREMHGVDSRAPRKLEDIRTPTNELRERYKAAIFPRSLQLR
jgi:uncharacterized protein YjbJ (UPF0337 family)